MQLDSINQTHPSQPYNQQGNISSLPTNEQLLVLAQIFLHQLRAEIPESHEIQVRCAISHQRVMVLVERPENINLDTDPTVVLLARTMESHPEYITPHVEFFLRKLGAKRPYAKRVVTFDLSQTSTVSDQQSLMPKAYRQTTENYQTIETSSALTIKKPGVLVRVKSIRKSIPPLRVQAAIEAKRHFNPFAKVEKRQLSRQYIIGGFLVAGIAGTMGATYVMTRPCVMNECQQLQVARKLDLELAELAKKPGNPKELQQLQSRIKQTQEGLKVIPHWSSRYREMAALKTQLLTESQAIDKMMQGFTQGIKAINGTRSFTDDTNELRSRQKLWRNAIAPLESVRPNSKFYEAAQSRLSIYRNGLQAVNVQLLAQGKWQQRLNTAKAVAQTAMQRDTKAKSLPELKQAANTWQVVINALKNIPETSPVYLQAQQLFKAHQSKLATAQKRVTDEENSGQFYNQARNTAKLAQTAMENSQWQQAVSQWQQALTLVQQIAPGTSHYSQAQSLVTLYASALNQARTQIVNPNQLEIARRDLENTCQGTPRICNFSLANKAITVRMTPDYEQNLAANLQSANGTAQQVSAVTNHLQVLQTALETISDNVDLPLFIFDAQGSQIYTHIPRSRGN